MRRRTSRHGKHLLLLLAFCGLALPCSAAELEGVEVASTYSLDGFKFGIEYGAQELPSDPSLYSTASVTWTKWNGYPHTRWRDLEPEPPIDGVHAYTFGALDRAVAEHQSWGFRNIVIVLQAASDWASECGPVADWQCPDQASDLVASPPRDESRWQDYRDFVSAVVERYDGDGVDDAPGLLAPIRYWEIETEVQHGALWQVTCADCTRREYLDRRIEQYVKLLRIASAEIRAADRNAQVILAGSWFWDAFDRGPLTEAQLQEFLETPGPVGSAFSEAMEFNSAILRETDSFDAVEFHQLSHYTGVEGSIEWMREFLARQGVEKDIFVGDALSGPTLFHNGPFQNWEYLDGARLLKVVGSGKDLLEYEAEEVEQWYRAEQARYTAKQVLLAIGSGASGINLFTWKDFHPVFFDAFPLADFWLWWTWGIQGLADVTFPGARIDKPRPVLVGYHHLASRLEGVTQAERLALEPGVRAYRLTTDTGSVLSLWLDEPIARQLNAARPSRLVHLPLAPGTYQVTVLPTTRNTPVRSHQLHADRDGLLVEISDMPILLEAKR